MIDRERAHTHYRGLLGRLQDEQRSQRDPERGVEELDEEIARLQEEDRARRAA